MTYQVRPFDLSGVQGLSKKALDMHLGLYKGYVDNLNKLLEQAPQAKGAAGGPLALDGYARRFAFEYNGVMLHELFFEQLAGTHRPASRNSNFIGALTDGYGGFEGWKSVIEGLAKTRGVGWVISLCQRGTAHVHSTWVDLHHLNMPANSEVVFVLDVWEHAFLTDFAPSQRADYVKAVLDNIDWPVVEARYAAIEAREAAHA